MSKEHGLDWPKWRKSVNDSRSQKVLRIKQERDDLLAMLKAAMKAAYSFRPGFSEMSALELIERIDRE